MKSRTRTRTVLAVLAIAAIAAALYAASRWRAQWGDERAIQARMMVLRTLGVSYEKAVASLAAKTGAPQWWVRMTAPMPAFVAAECTVQKRNPWKVVNYVFGFVGGAILAAIPITAPAGALVLTAAAGVDRALPKTHTRPCKGKEKTDRNAAIVN